MQYTGTHTHTHYSIYVFIGPSDDVIEQIVCNENDISNNG